MNERMLDGIVEMRQYGLLTDGNRADDDSPIISDILIETFLHKIENEDEVVVMALNTDERLPVTDAFQDRMRYKMGEAIAAVAQINNERTQLYMGIISCIKPFDKILGDSELIVLGTEDLK